MSDVRTPELVINKLSKQQYESIQNPSDTELYLVPEDEEHKPICYPTTASDVWQTSMLVKSSVSDNGKILTENGFVYNTSGNPTVSDTKVVCELNNGQFETKLTGLAENTQYYIRSYSINSSGLSYGDELVQSTLLNPIPSTYQLVDMLISINNGTNTSNPYLDINYVPNINHTIKLNGLVQFSSYSGDIGGIFGCVDWNTPTKRCEFGWIGRPFVYYSTTDIQSYYPLQKNVIDITLTSNFIYIDDIKIPSTNNYPTNINLLLFARNAKSGSTITVGNYFHGAISSFKVLDSNNQYIHRMYPVYRIADNKPGMYDIVSGVFYTNQGTGEFIVGLDKEWDE